MKTPRDVIEALGAGTIAEALGLHAGRVRQAAGGETLPAAWFKALRDLGAEKGVAVPEEVFAFKPAKSSSEAAA